ncbi:HD domain-containing protein [Salinisphaera sp. RV14]|uniref:HD domain-containing protein n=1 Tax=unclassified Salinisphaera TaxID=2649847 RepID=UPI003F8436C1
MISIAHLAGQRGAHVSGIYRLIAVKPAAPDPGGSRAQVTIADATGFALCRLSVDSDGFAGLTDVRTRFVHMAGRVIGSPSGMIRIDAARIERVLKPDRPSWHLMSRTWVPVDGLESFDRLIALLDRLTCHHMRSLAHRLFSSQAISEPFLCIPASRLHHHAVDAGLLMHSVECAEMAETLAPYVLPAHERDLAVIGALLHDVAKIRIMRSPGQNRHAIYGVTQEALNLEVLAPFLRRLDRDWPEGGAGLREMLAPARPCGRPSSASPLLLTDLVRYIDRLSSGADIRAQSFRESPAWRRCARTEQGDLVKRILPAVHRSGGLQVSP